MTDTFDAVLADDLAQEIRRVDGSHSLGAGALAEALLPFLSQRFAAAHAAEVAERDARIAELKDLLDGKRHESNAAWVAAEAAERDAREVRALLDEAWGHVPSGSLADRIYWALKRRAAIATTEQDHD